MHSLSKRSNLAGYRAGFVAGDPQVVADLLAVRKHAGMIVPRPVQEAMVALLGDHDHVERAARSATSPAARCCGPRWSLPASRIEHSEGSLYLWATRGEPGRDSVDFLASHGILVAPGDFYGEAAASYVRVALTATDERVAAAGSSDRLAPAARLRL